MTTATAAEAPAGAAVLRRFPAWGLTALLAVVWLIVDPPTPDLAAHAYRADVADRIGLGVWEQGWFAGHHLPGYSVLMPPLAALLSPQAVAAAAVVVAAWCFERLAATHWSRGAARAASLWFAVGVVSTLVGGQLAFAAGLAPALGALLVGRRGHPAAGAALGALTTLTSPVTAAFLVLACTAWWLAGRRPAPLAIAAGAIVPGLLIVAAFPQGGIQPFRASSFAWAFGVAVALVLAFPRDERALRIGAGLYALVLLAGVLLDTPLGGNLVRLAAVFGGPLAAGALWDRRRAVLWVLALPLLYWQWLAPVRSVARASGDPSSSAAYHAPLLAELDRRAAAEGPFRTEIPFTANHWETRFVPLTPPARPRLGTPARREAQRALLRRRAAHPGPLPRLAGRSRRPVRRAAGRRSSTPPVPPRVGSSRRDASPACARCGARADWRLYRLDGARPLATGHRCASPRSGSTPSTLTTPRPAATVVRVRFTPYWALTRGAGACRARPAAGRACGSTPRARRGWRSASRRGGSGPTRPRCTD